MENNQKIRYWVYGIAIIVLVVELLRFLIFVIIDRDSLEYVFLLLSILVSVAAIIIRFWIIDPKKVSVAIDRTKKDTMRFLNIMPLAMIICTTADFLMKVDFIIGMLTFVIAQIMFIFAYTGLISVAPQSIFAKDVKSLNLLSTAFWVIIPAGTYFLLIFNPSDFITLAVIPYIIVLSLMGLLTFFAFNIQSRTIGFRLSLATGGLMFFISDALLAINKFNTPIPASGQWVGLTYLMAVLLLQYAILFLQTDTRKNTYK